MIDPPGRRRGDKTNSAASAWPAVERRERRGRRVVIYFGRLDANRAASVPAINHRWTVGDTLASTRAGGVSRVRSFQRNRVVRLTRVPKSTRLISSFQFDVRLFVRRSSVRVLFTVFT